jgi:hypothetical protein
MNDVAEQRTDWRFRVPPFGADPAPLQPEKRLMLAVLETAVGDFQKYATARGGRGRQLFSEAQAWFESTADRSFDFENICQALGIDASYVRAGMRRWCSARRHEAQTARTVLHFTFRRGGGTLPAIWLAS